MARPPAKRSRAKTRKTAVLPRLTRLLSLIAVLVVAFAAAPFLPASLLASLPGPVQQSIQRVQTSLMTWVTAKTGGVIGQVSPPLPGPPGQTQHPGPRHAGVKAHSTGLAAYSQFLRGGQEGGLRQGVLRSSRDLLLRLPIQRQERRRPGYLRLTIPRRDQSGQAYRGRACLSRGPIRQIPQVLARAGVLPLMCDQQGVSSLWAGML
jgi:hypothetical protein